jgi:choline kinase
MQDSKSVVISAAGIGSRLGMNMSKSLLQINGKTLIEWQLTMLENFDDVIIVVGFQADTIIEKVSKIRSDILFVLNHNYLNTKTSGSLKLGAKFATKEFIALDGDTLVSRNDIELFAKNKAITLGISEKYSIDAVDVEITNNYISGLDYNLPNSEYEWNGPSILCKDDVIEFDDGNVFGNLKKFLPVRYAVVNSVEIDYQDDINRASIWIDGNLSFEKS